MNKRENKSKEQLVSEIREKEKANKDKTLVKLLYPFIEKIKTIYDAQTVLSAISGYIKLELANKTNQIKVSDLKVDLSKEEESEITTAMKLILGQLETESAEDASDLLDRFANILPKIGAHEYLKNSMSILKITDIIKE